MTTEETPAVPPEPTSTHEAGPWNVYRQTLVEHSHEVAGIRYIGGAGHRLDDLLRTAWTNEARQLATDLTIALRYLPDGTIRSMLSELRSVADATLRMRGSVPAGIADTGDIDVTGLGETEPRRSRPRRREDAASALADAGDDREGAIVG